MRLSLLLISLLFSSALFSQMANDSIAPSNTTRKGVEVDVLGDLENLMTEGKSKDVSDAYENFEGVFASGVFMPEEQETIKQTITLMRSRRLGASSHFKNYLESLVHLKTKDTSPETFNQWQGVLTKILLDKDGFRSNAVNDFLEFSNDFYQYNALNYSPASVSWYTFADGYEWRFEGKPIFKVANARVIAIRHEDTLTIDQTDFIYFPLEKELHGSKGKADWGKTSLGASVSVNLEQYTIETIRSIYHAPIAYLTHPKYFGNKRIKGSFTDKLVADNTRTSYPRFESEEEYLNISNVHEGVRLRGGFRLHGSTVFAAGTKERPAEILVLNEQNQPRYQGVGNLVTLKNQDRIIGEGVRSIVFLGADSLFHPSANVRLNLSDLSLELTRGKTGTDRNPFFHSLHQMNIHADFIKAYLLRDSLVIGRPTASFTNKKAVTFESIDFFNKNEYNRIQSIASANPIAIMKATSDHEGTRFMSAGLLASRINSGFTVENIKPLLFDLVSKGFINYNTETNEIEIKEKVFHYVNADAQIVDYDLLKLTSEAKGTNATIDLKNGYTFLEGIPRIEFSERQQVAAIPYANRATVKGDRNFDFDGKLFAGFAIFQGKDFHFNYKDFQLQMDSVKYLDLYVPTGELDKNNRPAAVSIDSRIEKLNGVVLIDAPNNKSGIKDIPIFPSLQSKDFSYVFYDKESTQGGTYDRDSFYFELNPFTFDHLDKFGPQDIHFKGRMVTNGIFPEIKETLILRDEDKSLGFVNETPEEGYATFQGKGTYKGLLDLSNKGLQGIGTLEYIQATINADDFLFTPDRATASAEAFDLEETKDTGVPVPQVRGEAVNIEWRPYSDSLLVTSEEADFDLYKDNDHKFDGTLVLTPEGLKGYGELEWSLARAKSDIFSFGVHSAVADTMNINIKSLEDDERLALETDNVNGILDFDESTGHFEANDEDVVTRLPHNQYMTTMNEFDWDMTGNFVAFESEEGQPALFTSIHPDQDSLKFRGEEATYNLATSLLQIQGVDHIVTADAFIYPDSQYVEIAPNAEMAVFENAKIIADTTNKYHVINRATVTIKGRKEYIASGFYEYNVGPHEQEFELENIIGRIVGKGDLSKKKTVTRATGEIEPTDTFFIDHKTLFRGTISLDAESKGLQFDGFARIDAELLPKKSWFTVSFQGDKNDLVIDYDIPNSYDSEPLFTGLFLSKEYTYVYPRVLSTLHFRKDRQLLPLSSGVFRYLEDMDQFVFGDSSVVLRNELVGNKMIFKNKDGSVEAEGKFNLGSGLKYVSVDAAGRMHTAFPPPAPEVEEIVPEEESSGIMLADDPDEDDSIEEEPIVEAITQENIPVTAEFMLGLKMLIPEQLLKIVHNDFLSTSFESKAIGYLADVNFYNKVVRELFPPSKERENALQGLALGFLDMPKKANPYTFLFSQMPMKWHQDYQSFVSTKKKNGLTSINGESLNKTIECYVELKMPSTVDDDRLYVYLKSPSGLFYFFGFKQGILSITSNNTVFMQQLEGIKEKDRIMKMDDGETFEIQPVEPSSASLFLRRITAVQ